MADPRRDHADKHFIGFDISGYCDVFELPVGEAVFGFVGYNGSSLALWGGHIV